MGAETMVEGTRREERDATPLRGPPQDVLFQGAIGNGDCLV